MKQSQGSKGIALIECINPRLQKYRVRWNVKDVTPTEENKSSEMVSFAEEEFLYKPQPKDIEKAISTSGVDATEEELQSISSLLGYEYETFQTEMDKAKTSRIAADPMAQILEITKRNRLSVTDISDTEALEFPSTFFTFDYLCKQGKELAKGVILRYKNDLWRVVQAHTPQSIYPPSMETASLYSIIELAHAGTLEDPIPYKQGVAFEKGKYYEQYGVIYLCILTTETGYPSDLKDLPTIVQKVE